MYYKAYERWHERVFEEIQRPNYRVPVYRVHINSSLDIPPVSS